MQEACVSAILRLAGDWIARSALHVLWLNCKAAYGYEYLFTRLGQEFNTRVKTPPRHATIEPKFALKRSETLGRHLAPPSPRRCTSTTC